jgi:hypothetical protein
VNKNLIVGVLPLCFLVGIVGTCSGTVQCVKGHTYSVAAQHEKTSVGRVTRISHFKGTPTWHYVFSADGVMVNDQSPVCATPLAPGACENNGPVLVHYSYEPFRNSTLQDFTVASDHVYRFGGIALAIGLPFLALSIVGIRYLVRGDEGENDPDS